MSAEPKRYQFFMGDDQWELFKKTLEESKGKKLATKIDIVPRVKNVGYISFIQINSKSKEVKQK